MHDDITGDDDFRDNIAASRSLLHMLLHNELFIISPR